MEYYTRKNIFDNCYEAMSTMLKEKRILRQKHENNATQSYSEYTNLANDFLALSIQFEKEVDKNYSHYPKLAKDMAIEVLKMHTYDLKEEIQKDFIANYIEKFDIQEVLTI